MCGGKNVGHEILRRILEVEFASQSRKFGARSLQAITDQGSYEFVSCKARFIDDQNSNDLPLRRGMKQGHHPGAFIEGLTRNTLILEEAIFPASVVGERYEATALFVEGKAVFGLMTGRDPYVDAPSAPSWLLGG
jgi:hypothetical protein